MEPRSRVLEEAIAASSSSMAYQEQVTAGAAALIRGEDSNWELGRRTTEVCGPSTGRGGDRRSLALGTLITVKQWSADIRLASGRRFSEGTAGRYRQVWEQFHERCASGDISWTEAWREIRGESPDPQERGDAKRDSYLVTGVNLASLEAKQNAFVKLAADPEIVAHALQQPEVRIALTSAQIAEHASQQAEFDRIQANRERRDIDNMLRSPGHTNRQFVTSAAGMVEKLTTNITTLKTILDNDTVSYLRPEDVRILASKLAYLRDQAQRCLDLLPQPQPA